MPNPAQEQLTGSGKKGTKKFKSPGEKKRKPESPGEDAIKTDESEPKKRKNDYVPAYRSAPYAIILTLFEKTCVNNDKGRRWFFYFMPIFLTLVILNFF